MLHSLKAVYYSRVSTEEETQVNALRNQIEEAKRTVIDKGWILIDRYVDEGKSGTSIKKRDEYKRLLEDMVLDKFDIIVVKSQDRLMRNVKDWYLFLELLQKCKKQLYFYLENRFYEPEDALITGIKAILAEEYSRELSKKINNAHRNRQRTGSSYVLTGNTWGYDREGKKVCINEKEAEIIKLIYAYSIDGYGSRRISGILAEQGVKGIRGNNISDVTIRKIIRNELYKGTVVMNKLHYDFNLKQQVKQPPEKWIRHEMAVPPIVSEEIWEKANEEMNKRCKVSNTVCSEDYDKETRSSRSTGFNRGHYPLSSKLICMECGSYYWRRIKKQKGLVKIDWMCSTYCTKGRKTKRKRLASTEQTIDKAELKEQCGCDNKAIEESKIYDCLTYITEEKYGETMEKVIHKLLHYMKLVLDNKSLMDQKAVVEAELNRLEFKREQITDKLMDGIVVDGDYKKYCSKLDIRKQILSDELREICIQEVKQKNDCRIEEISAFLLSEETQKIVIKEAAIPLLLKHTERIVISRTHLNIFFDCFESILIEK